ncbi:Oxidoreductase-like protein 4 [Elsinoe fawcettii]|nr:Oxidoreductase-like protein 4 [Elsinoe fawcettii]
MVDYNSTCRWAALSLSNIAAVFLPDILLPRPESDDIKHELVAVSTTGGRERATTWLADNKIPNASSIEIYQSWEEMLEKGDFDIVYISTPHPLHYQHTKKALQHKRNVLVEKPATMTRRQYEVLIDLAKGQKVVLMEAMWTRYLPATRYFQEDLLPRIGEVKRVYAEFSFPIVSADLEHSSRFLDKSAGAGSLLDQGVYALTWADLALNGLCADSAVCEVVYAGTMEVPGVPGKVDDITTVVLSKHDKTSMTQQAVGIVTTSMTIPGSSKPSFYQRLQAKKSAPSVRIEGLKASVAIPFPPIRPEELHVQWYGEEFVNEEGVEKEEIIRKPVDRGWGIWYQADVIAACVREHQTSSGSGLVIGADESLRVLGYMDKARQLSGIKYNEAIENV